MKIRRNITLDEESDLALKMQAENKHMNISQYITYLIWKDHKAPKENFMNPPE